MQKLNFPANFIWGTATAAYQVEGAVCEDGRGQSIWDTFSHTPGRIYQGDTGDRACDHYHRFREDIALMKEMGLKGYRFSVAWPRILPEGKGRINPQGLDFYNMLVDQLLEKGIEPFITLYHWDLPQTLQETGGWDHRQTTDYFADYATVIFQSLGDRVKKWLTLNEPWVISYCGHAENIHAPGFADNAMAVRVSHHLNLAHAKAVQVFRQLNQKGEIGITLNLTPSYPSVVAAEDKAAAFSADGFSNRWFLDPVLQGKYPDDMLQLFQEKLQAPVIQGGDLALISGTAMDFLGINYYSRHIVKKALQPNLLGYDIVPPVHPVTEMGWEIYPEGLYDLLMRLDRDYNHPRIFITENGAAFRDRAVDGRVADPDRIAYLERHFGAAHRAIQAGVKLEGYYIWSLMDNFEWAYGYKKRFGLIYVDYPTQNRIWKDSARWYQEVIRNNGI